MAFSIAASYRSCRNMSRESLVPRGARERLRTARSMICGPSLGSTVDQPRRRRQRLVAWCGRAAAHSITTHHILLSPGCNQKRTKSLGCRSRPGPIILLALVIVGIATCRNNGVGCRAGNEEGKRKQAADCHRLLQTVEKEGGVGKEKVKKKKGE